MPSSYAAQEVLFGKEPNGMWGRPAAGAVDERARLMIEQHMKDCDREREETKKRMSEMHAENKQRATDMQDQIRLGFGELHSRVSSVKNWTMGTVISVCAFLLVAVITILLSILTNGLPWAQREELTKVVPPPGWYYAPPNPPFDPLEPGQKQGR